MEKDTLMTPAYRLQLVNLSFGTTPRVVHAHGHHSSKPHWPSIREAFFASARRPAAPSSKLTIITCNNGHPAMGLLERSLDHLGLPYLVGGQGIEPWINSRDKPAVIHDLL